MAEPDGTPSDDQLLAAARRGNRDALEALILRHQPRVFRYGVKMCGNRDDASEVLQETLLAMVRSLGTFRGDSSVSTWLYTIARSFCIKRRRRSRFAPQHEESLEALGAGRPEDLADLGRSPEQQAASREVQEALDAAIRSLDRSQREVIVLRDVEGLSAPEVAQVTGLSVKAVKSRLHRARLALRLRLAPALGMMTAAGPPPADRCPDVVALFSRHLEGELDPAVCAEMQAHLEQCRHCRGACESLARTLALCRATAAPAIPLSVEQSVRHAIRAFLAHHSA